VSYTALDAADHVAIERISMKVLMLQGYACSHCWNSMRFDLIGENPGPDATVVGWCSNPRCDYYEMRVRLAPQFVDAPPITV
jgi:hypothetical protein